MTKIICIYHANCLDGFGAAWAVRKALGENVEFYPGFYDRAPPDLTNREVLLVDFSYKRPVLEDIIEKCDTLVILDHHKTAQDDLKGLNNIRPGVKIIFDMERSGAGLAWDHFHVGQERPMLINLIEDYDLWKFKYNPTKLVHHSLSSYEFNFVTWDHLFTLPISVLEEEGKPIRRKQLKDIYEFISVMKRTITIDGYNVPAINLPYTYASDAGMLLAKGEYFAACYYDTPTARIFSLRSYKGAVDVGKIAAKFGGGGHINSAGFSVPRDHELAFV